MFSRFKVTDLVCPTKGDHVKEQQLLIYVDTVLQEPLMVFPTDAESVEFSIPADKTVMVVRRWIGSTDIRSISDTSPVKLKPTEESDGLVLKGVGVLEFVETQESPTPFEFVRHVAQESVDEEGWSPTTIPPPTTVPTPTTVPSPTAVPPPTTVPAPTTTSPTGVSSTTTVTTTTPEPTTLEPTTPEPTTTEAEVYEPTTFESSTTADPYTPE